MWKSTGWYAKKLGVTRETIINWLNEGKFDKYQRTKGGHYRIWWDEESVVYGYCRVSSSKQSNSLITQENIIKRSHPNCRIFKDTASGFNFQRKGFKTILEQAVSGTPVTIVATTQDRITRTGFQFIKWVVELHGGSIEILENSSDTEEHFDTETLISFITSFVNSYYGKRSKGRHKKD